MNCLIDGPSSFPANGKKDGLKGDAESVGINGLFN